MDGRDDGTSGTVTGDDLVRMLSALGNPQRLRVVAALAGGRNYVSQLARELGISRPLLHLHLQRLEAAGLIYGTLELSPEGRAMRFYAVAPFALRLTPGAIAEAVRTLTVHSEQIDSADGAEPRRSAGEAGTQSREESS